MASFLLAIGAGLASFLAGIVLMPIILKLAHRFKWYDLPDKRKIHKGLIPRLGGVGIFLAVLVATLLCSALFPSYEMSLFRIRFIPIFVGFTLMHLAGLFDDFVNLKPLLKLSLQILAAASVAAGGFLINTISIPYWGAISLGYAAYPATILWIVTITNAINFIDGMDGLAAGICGFAALSMAIIALIQGQLATALLAFAIFGSVAGFLVYNFPPARIFMGDSGSQFLGFALAVFPLMGISKSASIGTLIIPLTLLTVPIIDTTAAVIRRIKKKRSIIAPDREHLHHKLLDMGLSENRILLLIYGFSFYLSVVAVTSVILPKEANVYVILIVWMGSLLAYYFLDLARVRNTARRQSKEDSTHTA
jgi:UDP-GlcNAc:undecaprenyl-phosphate GlcNAc-1-phosphate transferase